MNDRQRLFCDYYFETYNASSSYLKAYPNSKPSAAAANGAKLLSNPNIRARLAYLREHIAEVAQISMMRIVQELERIAFFNVNEWFEVLPSGLFKLKKIDNVKSLPLEVTACIASIKETREGLEIKFHPKGDALAKLTHLLGYQPSDKIDLTLKEKTLADLIGGK